MPLNLDPGELEPHREQLTELLPGAEEKRRLTRSWRVASGTFACPACDLPVAFAGAIRLDAALGCPYCERTAPTREFLTLTDSPRPTRVRVTATIGGSGVERGERDRAHRRGAAGDGEHERAPAQR